jgi:hypothetical protein
MKLPTTYMSARVAEARARGPLLKSKNIFPKSRFDAPEKQ